LVPASIVNPGVEAMATFELYTDQAGEYRWRLKSSNGRIIATSSEGYKKKSDCERGIEIVKTESPAATVQEIQGSAG
jgi:uncharacterized protein YegP (UPF0339 family)